MKGGRHIFEKPIIGVVGLGYVGLPTALAFHKSGFDVVGLDINPNIIEDLSRGVSHLEDASNDFTIPNGSSRWSLTSEYKELAEKSDIFLVSVPTPTNSDKTPDLTFVRSAFDSIIGNLPRGAEKILVLESTVYPGVTEKVTMEAEIKYGVRESTDFFVAYSPERVSPGEVGKSAEDVARIVGSNDEEIGKYLAGIYGRITGGGCKYVGAIKVAEAAKMVENTQRDIDLAFVNELAKVLPKIGVNVNEVLQAASTKWNFHRHDPGIGVGGHCIPVDPYYYIELCNSVGEEGLLSKTAREINEGMPYFAASEIRKMSSEGIGSVLVLGYSYKPEVGDVRETPVRFLIEQLVSEGVEVRLWDPLVSIDFVPDWVENYEDAYEASMGVDAIILATAHSKCIELDWERLGKGVGRRIVYDGRGKLSRFELNEIGWEYFGIGVRNEMETE